MRICKNDITDHIRELFGANPLRVPESRIQPMCMIEIKDKKPVFLGQFKYLVQGDFPKGPTIQNSKVAEVSGVRTKKIKLQLGFKILENFLKAFGIDGAAIGSSIKKAQQMAFSFDPVNRRYIEPLALGQLLSKNDLRGDAQNLFVEEIIRDKNKKLALITDVLVSNNFSLSTYDENETKAAINLPLIQEYIADMKLKIKLEKRAVNEIKFSGEEALTFAFSCVEIKIDPATGRFKRGDWIDNLRSKNAAGLPEENVGRENWKNDPKLLIDESSANPLLLEF